MAFSKAPLYASSDQITSGYFRAIGHPARLELIRHLVREGTCTVKALNKSHPISQESMSYHLESLRKAGLVSCIEKFPSTYYSIEKDNLMTAIQKLQDFFHTLLTEEIPTN